MTLPDRLLLTYLIETPFPLEQAVEMIAGEQSTGTFVPVPGETEEIKARFRTRLEQVTPLDSVDTPALYTRRLPAGEGPLKCQRALIVVSVPLEMVGTDLTTVLASAAGNIYELSQVSGLRLIDIEFPAVFADACSWPQFGVEGTRTLTGVAGRPIIGSVIKPDIGLTPEEIAALVREQVESGVDFIKDDELLIDPPYCPLAQRVTAVMRVINDHADRTGKRVMYAFNISGEIETMRRHHDTVIQHGGNCVQVNINHVGITGVSDLRGYSEAAIHGHRSGWGYYTRSPLLGMAFRVYQKVWRMTGVDHLHVNGLQGKFWEPDDSVVESIEDCLRPIFSADDVAMPVVASGQWGGQADETYRRTGTTDLMYIAGGGIMGHPDGPAAGVRAVQQAWEAAIADIPAEQYARDHHELARSIATFGRAR